MNDWITSTEAAAILGVSPGWLRQKTDEDRAFPKPYRPGARKFLWSRAAILAFRDKALATSSTHSGAVKSEWAAKDRRVHRTR